MRGSALPLLLAASIAGCGSDPVPMETPEVAPGPGSSPIVVALAGVSLASDCGASGATAKLAACVSTAPNCNCRQSGLQLKVTAKGAQRALSLTIDQVRIVDPSSGRRLGTLVARMPQKFDGAAYVDWDQQIAPGDDFTASYLLSAPDWSSIAPAGYDSTTTYRVEVDLSIGGQARTIKLDGVTREAPIAT